MFTSSHMNSLKNSPKKNKKNSKSVKQFLRFSHSIVQNNQILRYNVNAVFCMWDISLQKGSQGHLKPAVHKKKFDFTVQVFAKMVHSSNIYLVIGM